MLLYLIPIENTVLLILEQELAMSQKHILFISLTLKQSHPQNIFETSLHLGVAQISYAGTQVTETVISHVPHALETLFLHRKMTNMWFPIQS